MFILQRLLSFITYIRTYARRLQDGWRQVRQSVRAADAYDLTPGANPNDWDDPYDQAGPPPAGVHNIFTPHEAHEHFVRFDRLDADQPCPTQSEIWESTGNGAHVRQTSHLFLTVSGAITQPQLIAGQCAVCGGLDDAIWRCAECNIPLCRLHAILLLHRVYCPVHLQLELEQYDSWAARDAGHPMVPIPHPPPEEVRRG